MTLRDIILPLLPILKGRRFVGYGLIIEITEDLIRLRACGTANAPTMTIPLDRMILEGYEDGRDI